MSTRWREEPAAGQRPGLVVLSVQNMGVPQDPRVWREARTLRADGYPVAVIAPRRPGQPRREVLEGIEIVRYAAGPDLRGFGGMAIEAVIGLVQTARCLIGLRARQPVAVLHLANPPDTTALLAWALGATRVRRVFDQHDACPELLEAQAAAMTGWRSMVARRVLVPLLRWFERLAYRSADLVVLPNDSYRRIACSRGRVDPAAAVTIRSGPDRLRVDPAPPQPRRGAVEVVFAGVMGRQDRVDVLLDAVAEVLSVRPGAVAVDLVGDGDDAPRLRGVVDRLGIADAVRWSGWLTGDELHEHLAGADLGVSLDGDDAFSQISTMTKVPDYLAHGVPALVADLPENRVSAGAAAVYFRPGDPADLAKCLLRLVDEPATLQQLALEARRRAPALLWERSAPRLLAAYRWLLEGAPPVVPGDQPVTTPPRPARSDPA